MLARKFAARLAIAVTFVSISGLNAHAQVSCVEMSEMAFHIASMRDAGVPKTAVENRLRRDVSDGDELSWALVVVAMVYRAPGTAEQLRREILKKCPPKKKRK